MNARSTRTLRGRLLALVLLGASKCVAGCAHPRPETITARPALTRGEVGVPDAECVRWLSARRTWTGVTLGAASASAGAGGLTAVAGDDQGLRVAFGVVGLVAGVLSAVAAGLSSGLATDFGRHCVESNRPE